MLDELDRAVIHALHIDGRAPFSRIADVCGVSTQTVARRYRRLRTEAGLRVVGVLDRDTGPGTHWTVRLTCTPAATRTLAHSLAARPDTSWVKLTSGGTEIFAIVHVPDSPGDKGDTDAPHAMLLHDVPRRAGITAVSAHCLLHTYLGGPTAWRGITRALSPEQQERLRPPATDPADPADPRPLTGADHALLDVLRHDGRAGYTDLAAATGWSQATAARRLAGLRARGTLFFDVEVDSALLGGTTQTLIWMSVAPGRLDDVATTIAGHDELAVVAATTGPTNLLAQALCDGPADLHRYLTRELGALDGIRTLETAPVLRTLKRAGAVRASPPARTAGRGA
ncbi:Lrp/AsnC family transcriptional regulator [Actinomadura montaniterrae]|uniref:Lrp/AsnC family transcriptional regulator n=1 Tax=Actinomadura montaniterrae TaxID=1803903 RepID=A0A6L3VUM9_9ACTN|nr:Lrp/AsnC family transcriptional regulator [Actinomadura montaniterrae]KAB2379433.1 Lrp/AsnC family transcriptional regulator [Actinomadura montaniterrae]